MGGSLGMGVILSAFGHIWGELLAPGLSPLGTLWALRLLQEKLCLSLLNSSLLTLWKAAGR